MASLNLLQLPHEIIDNILSYLTYDEVSACRPTCKLINVLASAHLNQGFSQADRLHSRIQRQVKSKLPRRESERRNHPLARHVDILSAVETRLSLLSMTYSKYIDLGICCFIPGKVLDEIYRVLKVVNVDPNPPRAHELLQELRDISSMAMEHFDDKISPHLKTLMPAPLSSNELRQMLSSSKSLAPSSTLDTPTTSLISNRRCSRFSPMNVVYGRLREVRLRASQQSRKIGELNRRVADQEHAIADLNRRIVDYDQRFDDLLAEIARVRSVESGTSVGQTKRRIMKRNVPKSSHESGGTDSINSLYASSSDIDPVLVDISAVGGMSCDAGPSQGDEDCTISSVQSNPVAGRKRRRLLPSDVPECNTKPVEKQRRLKADSNAVQSSQRCLRNK